MSRKGWISPDSPSAGLTLAIHRVYDEDHSICIARKDGSNKFRQLFNVRASEIESMFPVMRDHLLNDSFFSINGFLPLKRRIINPGEEIEIPGTFHGVREGRLVRVLTSVFADIDCYKGNLSQYQAEMSVAHLTASGALPRWSIQADSGRGIWLYWLLADPSDTDDSRRPLRAWGERCQRWRAIQGAIGERLSGISYDPRARDIARVTRFAGSLNTSAGKKVAYSVAMGTDNLPLLYSLEEMESALGIERSNRVVIEGRARGDRDPARVKKGQQGSLGRWTRDYQRLVYLYTERKGWEEGTRTHGIWIMAGALIRVWDSARRLISKGEAVDDEQREIAALSEMGIRQRINSFCKGCRSPLSNAETQERILVAFSKPISSKMKHATIVAYLKVTAAEIAELELAGLGGWPARGAHKAKAERPPSRSEEAAQRRAAIQDMIAQAGGKVPTLKAIGEHLATLGLQAAGLTYRRDLKAMGKENPRGRDARTRKKAERNAAGALPFKP